MKERSTVAVETSIHFKNEASFFLIFRTKFLLDKHWSMDFLKCFRLQYI